MTGADERGSATVWMVALAGLLAAVGMAVVLVGAALVGRHRAGAAADLAALAGAGRAAVGDPQACAAAARVATANGGMLDGCDVRPGAVVEVRVRVPVRLGPLGVLVATGRARAGPVQPLAGRQPDPTGADPPGNDGPWPRRSAGPPGRPVAEARRVGGDRGCPPPATHGVRKAFRGDAARGDAA